MQLKAWLLVVLAACSAPPKPRPPLAMERVETQNFIAEPGQVPHPPSDATPELPPSSGVPPEPFAPTATFKDLVAALRRAGNEHVRGECILAGPAAGPLRIATYDASRSLEDPPADLDPSLEHFDLFAALDPIGFKLYADWGATSGSQYPTLVALTPAPRALRTVRAPVLAATDKGIYLGAIAEMRERAKLLDAAMIARVKSDLVPKAPVWVVTAEGDAKLSRVREALAIVESSKGTVVLAAPNPAPPVLAKPTNDPFLADPDWVGSDEAESCGAPTDDSGDAKGAFKAPTLARVEDTVQSGGRDCGGARPELSGAIRVKLRVAEDGGLRRACAERDDIHDESLRKCLLSVIRRAKLPAPDARKGIVALDVSVPFIGKPIRALCN